MTKTKVKFITGLALVSIMGFLVILINALTGIDIGEWADGFLFVIIGTSLILLGGIKMFIKYFDDGLDDIEVAKILTIIVGIFSILVGLIVMPIRFLDSLRVPQLDGIKVIIASLAIVIIIIETWARK